MYYLQSRYYNPTWGRFVNADALVSTGQGLLGNNMFAYCLNNPANFLDSEGSSAICVTNGDRNPLMIGNIGLGGSGGGGGGGYAFAGFSQAKDKIKEFGDFVTNASESDAKQNLKDHGMSFYKGVPIFAIDAMGSSALSFGIILMGSDNLSRSDFSDTLNHEYGHYVHMAQIGVTTYTATTAIPSLIGAGLSYVVPCINTHYMSQPWERIANQLGDVNDTYLPGANRAGTFYYLFTLIVSAAIQR